MLLLHKLYAKSVQIAAFLISYKSIQYNLFLIGDNISMIELQQYGRIVQKYEGVGQIRAAERELLSCRFEVSQFTNADIILICRTTELRYLDFPQISFTGTTELGERLLVEGQSHHIRSSISLSSEGKYQVHVFQFVGESKLAVGNSTWNGQFEIRFAIANLDFFGTVVEELQSGTLTLNKIELELENKRIVVRQLDDYKDRLEYIKNTRGSDITCELIIPLTQKEIKASFNLANIICDLLSLARGKRVNWLYFRVLNSGTCIYTEHQPRIVTSYEGFEVIDAMPPENTLYFLEQCYPHYINLDLDFQFLNVINIFTAIRSGGFLETRCLAAFSLIEYLAKKANKPPKGRSQPTLKQWLKTIVSEYQVPITASEIDEFKDIRNSLVHEMRFMPGDSLEQYWKVLHFLDRLLLRILGYDGYYINVTQMPEWRGSNKHKLTPTS
jgi:hypothetical protein